MAAITVTPASGRAKMSVLRVDVTAIPVTDTASYDLDNLKLYPPQTVEDVYTYYIEALLDGTRYLKSHVFTPSEDGKHTWNSIVLPAAGTWTFNINKVVDDTTTATTTFVAS